MYENEVVRDNQLLNQKYLSLLTEIAEKSLLMDQSLEQKKLESESIG